MKKLTSLFLFFVSLNNAYSFTWVGHRGTRSFYPENTISGMTEALKFPDIGTLELDVVISKDGEVVVSHEPWMNPDICVGPNGEEVKVKGNNFYKMLFSEIASYDCGSKFYPAFPRQKKVVEHKPRLFDLITKVDEAQNTSGRLPNYFIEIKSHKNFLKEGFQPEIEIFVDKVIDVLEKTIDPKRFHVISLDWRSLKYLQKKRPTWKIVALANIPLPAHLVIHKLGFKPTVYSPKFSLFPTAFIKGFHKEEIKVIPWTVNTLPDMQRLIDKGVDGIITDSPDLITQTRGWK